MRANLRATVSLLCGIILLCSSETTTGQTCRGKCGVVQDGCSCRATCVSLLSCCADYTRACLQLKPHSSSMLGGRALRILGLLLHPSGRLLCRFKSEVVLEGYIDADGRPHCISPLLYETGWIQFEISTDGIQFDRSGEYLSVQPSEADPAFQVTLVNATRWQNYGTPNVAGWLKMTWNGSLIAADKVNVELWGYREFSSRSSSTGAAMNGPSSPRAELSYLYSLDRNVVNSGAFGFVPESSKDHSDWVLGNIRITASSQSDGARDVQALWSSGHVLAWHLGQTFRDDSAAWAKNKCLQWDVLEENQPSFLHELIDCPCTLAQARADTGRFHADYSCDVETGSVCTYHPGSVHCVRALQASTQGSGQQCCYDGTGALVLTGDSIGGSTPDRPHDWGSPPYGEPPRLPGYSHWLHNVASFYFCCLWSDHCHVYFRRRPSSGCRNYRPPKAGAVFGDPHFMTFDGLGYTFNGQGEYHLVSPSPHRELSVQARAERVKLKNGTFARATWLSSVAVKEESSDVIEVRLAAGGGLQVLRNHKVLPFTEQRWTDLQGVCVFVRSPQSVTVMLLSGAAVEARLHDGVMAVTVLLPSEFAHHTRGLLGPMNSDPSDDPSTRRGEGVSSDGATPEEIFIFAMGWNVSEKASLFTYDPRNLLDDPALGPAFAPPEPPDDPLVADMLTTCFGEGAAFCKHDTLTTGSLAVGNATLRAFQNFQALMDALQPVVSCGWLPTPRNGKKNGTSYLQENTLSFSCDEGFTLYGSTRRTCREDGAWTGEQPYCITEPLLLMLLLRADFISTNSSESVWAWSLCPRVESKCRRQRAVRAWRRRFRVSTGHDGSDDQTAQQETRQRQKRETGPDGDPRTDLLNHRRSFLGSWIYFNKCPRLILALSQVTH